MWVHTEIVKILGVDLYVFLTLLLCLSMAVKQHIMVLYSSIGRKAIKAF